MSPPNLGPLEILGILQTWAVRFFVFLGILTMAPAILILLYDATLYVWRYLILAPLTGTPFPEQAAEATAREEGEEVGATTATVTRSTLTTVTGRRRRTLSGSAERPLVASVEPLEGLKGVVL